MLKVAITGGLGCGKSAVSRIFRELGAYVLSADDIVNQLLSPDSSVGKKVIQLLGTDIISNNTLNHARIAQKVFHDDLLLKKLEELLHPEVKKELHVQMQHAVQNRLPLFMAEIPLLYEANFHTEFDLVIAVTADEPLCIQRFIAKTGYDRSEYQRRQTHQLPSQEKAARADIVISNNSNDWQQLHQQVETIFTKLLSQNKTKSYP